MALIRFAVLVALLGTAALASVAMGERAARFYEAMLARRIASGLDALGLLWAETEVDGLVVRLSGHAPDPHAQALAAETVRLAAPAARLLDESSADLPPPPLRPAPRLAMAREGMAVTITGHLPDAAARAGLARAFAEEAPRLDAHDLTSEGAAAAREPLPIAMAARAVSRIPRAHAVLEPGHFRLAGLVADEDERLRRTAEILGDAPEGLTVDLAISVPPPVIAPFAVALSKTAGGGLRLERCAAREASEASTILAMLRRAGLSEPDRPCDAGLGGPPGDWPGAVAAGLAALEPLAEARLEIAYTAVDLLAAPGTSPETLAEAGRRLAEALPEGFDARVRAAPIDAAGEADPGAPVEPPLPDRQWVTVTAGPDGVLLAGRLPTALGVEALEALAAARFPGQVLRSALGARGAGPVDPGWKAAAFAAVEALARLQRGRAQVTDEGVELTGEAASPEIAGAVHRALAAAVPDTPLATAIAIDLPALVARVPLTEARCLAALNDLVAARPIRFAPGSAVLDPDAGPVIAEIAAVLRRCPDAAVEIGGHTDSQGSEGFNERLSAARARAVREALIGRGVRLTRLAVQGYGERRPVASNATEAGRERNRRIAFGPVAPPPETAAADDAAPAR